MKQLFIVCLTFLSTVLFSWQPLAADTNLTGSVSNNNYFVFSPDGQYLVKVFHTGNNTWVRIHETGQMKMVTQWQIPNFLAHTVRFSTKDPTKLLLADSKRLLVYRLIDDKQKLLFFQPKTEGQEIVQAYFNSDNDEIVWATKSAVYKTDTAADSQKEMARIPWEEGRIKSVANLDQENVAISLEDSNRILLFSKGNDHKPTDLKGHGKSVIGVQPVGKNKFVSLDSDYQLIIWNSMRSDPVSSLKLNKPKPDAVPVGFSLDETGENIQVLSKSNQQTIGQRYKLKDLEQGRVQPETVPMTMTSSGNIYSSVTSFPEAAELPPEPEVEKEPYVPAPAEIKKKNTLYTLAKTEAENGHYQAALDIIKRIPLDDPEYIDSRELKRRLFDAINAQNVVNAAREQITKGNYQSAKILLENALVKNPDSPLLNRQLKQIDEHLDDNTVLKFVFLGSLLVLIALLAFVLWKYQAKFSRLTRKAAQQSSGGGGQSSTEKKEKKSDADLRREFVYKLDETRKKLNKAAAKDTERRYKNTWMEMTARLNTLEKRARLSDKYLDEFLVELEKVQDTIEKLGSHNNQKTSGFKQEEFSKKEQKQNEKVNQEKTNQQHKQQEQKPVEENKPIDYHSILGVSKNASLEEIKRAYRQKMKDYHPDRHNASDFTWVKEEADKRTKMVQEAYTKLTEQLK